MAAKARCVTLTGKESELIFFNCNFYFFVVTIRHKAAMYTNRTGFSDDAHGNL